MPRSAADCTIIFIFCERRPGWRREGNICNGIAVMLPQPAQVTRKMRVALTLRFGDRAGSPVRIEFHGARIMAHTRRT